MSYYLATIRQENSVSPKGAAVGLLTVAAVGESLAATAALKAVEGLPENTRWAQCVNAAIGAALGAVDQDYSEGGGMAFLTILVGTFERLIYRSVGRFRAISNEYGTIHIIIQAEDLEDAKRSWHQRFPACMKADLVEISRADAVELQLQELL